jgi:hypothetical protein
MKLIFIADDRASRMEITMPMAHQLRAAWAKNGGSTRYVVGSEILTHYTNRHVVKSVLFRVYKGSNGTPDGNFLFENAQADIYLGYDVLNGQVVQGSMGRAASQMASTERLQAEGALSSEEVRPDNVRQALSNVGTPVMATDNASKKLAMFWSNGVKWIKVGGSVDVAAQKVSFRSARMGMYQIKEATLTGDLTLIQVYPRIITPNGDGLNDEAIFQFGEGSLSGKTLSGEIFDVTGQKIATLKPGPDPESTLKWDGKSDGGQVVPSGIYIYQLSVAGQRVNGTLVVAR